MANIRPQDQVRPARRGLSQPQAWAGVVKRTECGKALREI